ncbi:WD40 repeat protein [Kitasatospora sp. GP30]|nr:WD40 repeat protein [Kitasatospora sp. GP30]
MDVPVAAQNHGMPFASRTGHQEPVRSVTFSPSGKILAGGSDDRTVHRWEVATHSAVTTRSGRRAPVTSVAFSRDGKLLASGSQDKTVPLWSA